ncbi:peptidoglycan-binding protein LysM [Burkholderia latens]|uniref:Peptidoglycan-binding protein LysM n=1 Tax=Burkholderia latens TaxID=488446 RepID=A0AAP1G6Y8_9BURK|nr:LWXIA domain-containing protein [Burkholderia latens]KVA04661.1 peptidoglycan-binding protein LysM [Burkholderia latens]
MVLMAVGGGGPVSVPQPQTDNDPAPGNGAGSNPPAQTPEQQALAAAQAETQRLLQIAQAEMATLKRLHDQGASQADLDNQVKKAEYAWGAVQAAVENQMRFAADGGGDANKAIAGVAADLRNASPKDPVLGSVLDDAQKAVSAESAPERATNEKAFEFALAMQKDQGAHADVQKYNALPGGVRRADPDAGAQVRQAAATADTNANNAYTALTTALRHEYGTAAATLRLKDAKADYAAWQKEPGGARRADEADITRELSQAQSQYDKVVTGGDDTALTYVTADEQKQVVAAVKQNHDGMWYTGLVDALGEESQLKRTIATINPDDPSLSPQMKQLAKSDPVTFALLQDTGVSVDPNDPKLSPQERALAQQNPLAEAFVKMTGIKVDTAGLSDADAKALNAKIDQAGGVFAYAMAQAQAQTQAAKDPAEAQKINPGYQQIQTLLAAAPDVRLQYTKQQVAQLMQDPGSNPGAALQVLKTNMDASFSLDERQALWTQAGQPHFDAKFIHSQIDPLMQKPDSRATDQASMQARADGRMNADKVGKWMQDILANAPPEFAGAVLDTVEKDFGNKWTQSNTGTPHPYGDGIEFYKGLSTAVGLADQQPTASGVPVQREDDVANWLLDANGNAKTLIYTLRGSDAGYGFDSVRQALSSGVDPALSKALLSKMQNDDRFSSGFANDFQLRYDQGVKSAQNTQQKAAASASYKFFQTDPDKQLKAYFDDFQKNLGDKSYTFATDSDQLKNFVGAGLGIQPDDPAAVPTDRNDVPSMALLEQLIVSNGQLQNGTGVNSHSLYAQNSAATQMIQAVVDQIRKVGGDHAVVSLVPIYYVSKQSGTAPSALFKVQVDGHPGQYKLIDDRGWQYDSVDNYQHNNALSDDGKLYVPKSLMNDAAAGDLSQYQSIDAHKTEWYQHLEHALEIGTGILAAAGGVVLIASGIGAPVGGALLGAAWTTIGVGMAVGATAAVGDLKNLSDHGQSIGFGNEQARGDWISLIGSGAGFAGGGLGMAAKSLAEASSLLRTTGQVSDLLTLASRGEGVTADVAGLGRFAQEADAFESMAQTTGRTAGVFNVTGGVIGGYQMADQGVSLVKNWDAMSDSDRAQQLLNLGIGVAQMGLGSHTLMERPIRAITKTPAPSAMPRPLAVNVVETLYGNGLANQRLAVGEIGNPWQHAEEQAASFGEPADEGGAVAPADKGLRARVAAWLRARRMQGTPDGDALALRLAPDGEPVEGAATPAVADALAADAASPAEAGVPASGARPASWEIPARIAADRAILSDVVARIISSGNHLEDVEYYVYALEDAEGNLRNPEEDGLPATDKGDLLKDMSAAKADERRAKAVDDEQARAAVAPDEDGTIGVTRYATYHDALMVGADGVAGGRYRIALVDQRALAADGTVPPEAVVGHIGLTDAGGAFVLSMNDAYDRTLRVVYPHGFDPQKPLIRSEDGRRVDVINASFGMSETQWAAYPRREADLAIYSDNPIQPENRLPPGERPLLPVPPGYFAVYAHAWADAFASATGKAMTADDMAEMIRQSGWDGKSPVILYACGAGTRVSPLAQLLANVLGVDVYGASGFVAWRSPRYRADGSPDSGYTSGILIEPGAPDQAGVPDHSVTSGPRTYRFSPAVAVIDQGAHPVDWSSVAPRPVSNQWGDRTATGDARVPIGVYVWRMLTRRGSIINPRSDRPASALEMTHALEALAWKGYTPGTPIALDGPRSGADPALLQEFADLIQAPVFGRLGDDDATGWHRAVPNPNRRLARFEIEPDVNGKFSPGGAQPIRINPLELRPVPGTSVVNLLGHATARQFLRVSGFDIAESHGTQPRDVSLDSSAAITQGGKTMSPRQFARALLDDPAYTEGNGVLLTGCYLGAGGYSFAQELAYELQVPVIASIASNSVRGTGALELYPLDESIKVPANDPDVGTRLYLHVPEAPDASDPPMVFAQRGEPTTHAPAHGDAPVEPVQPVEAEIDPHGDSGRRGADGTPGGVPGSAPDNAVRPDTVPGGSTHPRLAPEPDAGEPPVHEPIPLVEVAPDRIYTADEWAARVEQAAEAEADDGLSGKTEKIYPKTSRVYTDRKVADGGIVTTTIHGRSVLQPGFDDVTGIDATQHPEFLRPADTLLMPADDPLHAVGARGLMSPPGHHVVFGHGISADAMLGPDGRPLTPDEVAERVAPHLEPEQDVTLYSCYGGSNKHDPLRIAPGQVRAASATFAAALAQRLSELTGRPTSVWAPPDILLVERDGSATVRGTRLTGQVDKDRLPMQRFRGDPARAGRAALPAGGDAQAAPTTASTASTAGTRGAGSRPSGERPPRPTVPRVADPAFADPDYDFTAIPDNTFESVTLDHPFRTALADRPGVIGDAARVTQPGGTVSQRWPSEFLDKAEPTRVIDDVMQAFHEAGLTNLRVEFVTHDGSDVLGSGTNFGALDPEAGWFRFSGTVPDAPAAATHAPGRTAADARLALPEGARTVAQDELGQALDSAHTGPRNHAYVPTDALPDATTFAQPDLTPQERVAASAAANLDAVESAAPTDVALLSALGHDPARALRIATPDGGELYKPAGVDMYVVRTRDPATGAVSYRLAGIDGSGLPEGYTAVHAGGTRAVGANDGRPTWPTLGPAGPAGGRLAGTAGDPSGAATPATVSGHANPPAPPQRTTPAEATDPQAVAATWLDSLGRRTLTRVDGRHAPTLDGLGRKLGTNAHVLITAHADAPKTGAEHAAPTFVAVLETDQYGVPGPVRMLDGSRVPKDLNKALVKTGASGRKARRQFDFYVSPVAHDELMRFGGASKIETKDGTSSWPVAASGHPVDNALAADVVKLHDAPGFKRPRQAVRAVEGDRRWIHVVEEETGKVLGYAERNTNHEWKYYEKASVGDTEIPEQDLRTVFRRRRGGIPVLQSPRRGIRFVVSDVKPEIVDRIGGFQPTKDTAAAEKPPRRTLGDVFQAKVPLRQPLTRADQGRANEAAPRVPVDPHLLPSEKSVLNAVDFSGNSVPHLLTAIRNGAVDGNRHVIYVFKTDGAVAESLGNPLGVIAARNGEMRWFDNIRHVNNLGRQGVSLDEMPIGNDRFGTDVHFLLTQLRPREFLRSTRPTRIAALQAREKALREQLSDAEARGQSSAPFRALAARTRSRYNEVLADLHRLRHASTAAPAALSIEPYQPGLSSSTVVAFNLRNGAAKTEQYFPTHDQIEAYNKQAQRAGKVKLVLKGEPQAVMIDPGMWRTLLNNLYVARDVSTSASRFLPVPGKLRAHTRKFGAATVADHRIQQIFTRSDPALQDRMVPMARSLSLSDDPALMRKMVEQYGGVTPVVTLVVDPNLLAAVLGKAHDPDFLRAVKALGDQKNAVFDGKNGVIHPAPGTDGEALALDHLAHLHAWLDEAARTGFAIRLETAPARALVSGTDYRYQSGTNHAYHDYVRVMTALEKWSNANPDKTAPNVMITFHGWDAVPESVPGAGHEKLLRAVLERGGLEWVHVGLSFGTHGADFIGNQDLTGALAKLIVENRKNPSIIDRLHGADALTRVFERVDRQTLANQHQLLFAEVERIGAERGMTPAEIAELRHKLYEGNTTVWLNQARKATIEHATEYWKGDGRKPRGTTQKGARSFARRWLDAYGAGIPDRVTTRAQPLTANPLEHWSAVVHDPALINDGTKPIGTSRRETAQLANVDIPDAKRAQAELHALRVHDEPLGPHRPPPSGRRIAADMTGATAVGASGAVVLEATGNAFVGPATNSLYAGLRVGRVFQALHHGAVASLKNADPRVFDHVVDRLVRGLQKQLKANGFDVDARGTQLEQIAHEGKAAAAQLRALNKDGVLTFDETVTHLKAIADDMLGQMQGVVGGTSLKLLHRGSPRHSVGRVGRLLALGGYGGTITINGFKFLQGNWLAGGQALGGIISAASTGIVYKGGARGVNAENRSQIARLASATGDYVTSAVGLATGIHGAMAAHTFGDGMTGVLGAMSGALLGAGRLHSQFPNATPWMARLPTGVALLPVGIFAITQAYGVIKALDGSDDKNKKPGLGPSPSPSSSPSSTPTPTLTPSPSGSAGATPTAGASVAPAPTAATRQPGATASPTVTPSQPAQPSAGSQSATPTPTPLTVDVVAGDSLWTIAENHEGTLLDAAHVPADERQRMSDGQRIDAAFNEILQLNRNLASHPGDINPGQQVIVG